MERGCDRGGGAGRLAAVLHAMGALPVRQPHTIFSAEGCERTEIQYLTPAER